MTRAGRILLEAQLETKRGELRLRSALGTALVPGCFRPEIVRALKDAWLGARNAGGMLHRAILTDEQPGNVLDLAGARARRAKGRRQQGGGQA